MSDLRDLYQEVILDHYRKPRNFRKLEDATRQQEGHNPLCGDKVTVYLRLEDGVVRDLCFQSTGCAISTASASMMTEALKGKTLAEAESLFHNFRDLVTGKIDADSATVGKLAVFAGVREYPVRVKCASLPWHTLHAALEGAKEPVSTE
jgi:nitrogen fixation NifU-like protein